MRRSFRNIDVHVFGVPRSGTTLLLNLITDIVTGDVSRAHHPILWKDKVIIPLRDFRDCIVSYDRFISGLKRNRKSIGLFSLIRQGFRIKRYTLQIDKQLDYPQKPLYLQYHLFINDFDYIFDKLEGYLNIKIGRKERKFLKIKHCCENQKPQMLKARPGLIHISKDKTSWEKIIPKQYHFIIYLIFRKELLNYGFYRYRK